MIAMENKKTGRGKFILLGIGVFVLVFFSSVAIKMTYRPAGLRKYTVDWTPKVGTVHTDLKYGNLPANKFDLYLPANKSKKAYGLVVYLHAGGFTTGDKSDDAKMLQWLCSRGYVAAGINYTLRNQTNQNANVLSQSLEIKKSIPFVIQEAEKLGYKVNAMAVSGGSAGGTLAMLYAYRDAVQSPVPVKMLFEAVGPPSFYAKDWSVYGLDKDPKAAAGLFSVMSGTAISAEMINTSGYEELIKPISAFKWIGPKSVPTVCAYGRHDKVCPFNSVKYLVKALEDNKVKYEYIEFPHSGHGLQNDDDLYVSYMQKVEEYLATYLPVN